MWKVLFHTRDAKIKIDFVVVRRDVFIGNRPVLAVIIVGFRFEIQIGQTQREPAPDVCLATEEPRANPGIIGAGIWMVAFIDNDVLAVVRATPALYVRIDVFGFGVGRIRWFSDGVFVE